MASALEVFAGNELDAMIDERGGYAPTPVVSHTIISYNKNRKSGLADDTPIEALASTIKALWICEHTHQQLQEELGLDHFEGRSWHGLHRHALMTLRLIHHPLLLALG